MSVKTTVYLPDELKSQIESEARRRHISEAEVIRQTLTAGLRRPRPRGGFLTGPVISARVDELLEGFGTR